jgi:predicted acyl esterase
VRLIAARGCAVALCVAMVLSGCGKGQAPHATGRGPCAVTKQEDVPARMRDGTVLRADVYRPTTSEQTPVILMRTQYGKSGAQVTPSRYQPPD